ncbi:hypothetical protein [Noviherbaspirillum saxi]|uniref:Uncharacterized protein n=1 Tax=Noviherbaspirillum saxi TaxID=2320863 RepID=A0A3A3FI07_9BURK|nr:hypothetical protein [Noviherbaspirillum saxi]RJF92154.1 hypothetical protein D3871_26285 [Noviherbaspirillum saxi]
MNTLHLLESKMVSAHDDLNEAGAEPVTPESMPELVDLSMRSLMAVWALKTRHQVDYDLALCALQSIK